MTWEEMGGGLGICYKWLPPSVADFREVLVCWGLVHKPQKGEAPTRAILETHNSHTHAFPLPHHTNRFLYLGGSVGAKDGLKVVSGWRGSFLYLSTGSIPLLQIWLASIPTGVQAEESGTGGGEEQLSAARTSSRAGRREPRLRREVRPLEVGLGTESRPAPPRPGGSCLLCLQALCP